MPQDGYVTGSSGGGGGGGAVTAGAGLSGGGTPPTTLNVGANADGSITVNADDIQVGILATNAQHGNRGGGALHALAVAAGAAGFLSGADKTKLDALPALVGFEYVGTFTASASSITLSLDGDTDDAYMLDISEQDHGAGPSFGSNIGMLPNGASDDCSLNTVKVNNLGVVTGDASQDWGAFGDTGATGVTGALSRVLAYLQCNRAEGIVNLTAFTQVRDPSTNKIPSGTVCFGNFRGGNLTSLNIFTTRGADPRWQVVVRRMRRQP